jgi:hypothetical protein
MNELSDNMEDAIEKITQHLAEISGETFLAHDITTKFRRSLIERED